MMSSTAQLPSHTDSARALPELPTHVLQALGLAASDLENPSRETFDKIVSGLKKTLGLLQTARYRLAEYGDREPLVMPSTEKSHCVRCHKDYAEYQNTNQACVIAHWGDLQRLHKHSDGSTWEWGGCGCTFESDYYDWCDTDESCYEARHTTDPDEVEYVSGSEEDEDEEDAEKDAAKPRWEYNDDHGVRTCRQRGCKRDRVKKEEARVGA